MRAAGAEQWLDSALGFIEAHDTVTQRRSAHADPEAAAALARPAELGPRTASRRPSTSVRHEAMRLARPRQSSSERARLAAREMATVRAAWSMRPSMRPRSMARTTQRSAEDASTCGGEGGERHSESRGRRGEGTAAADGRLYGRHASAALAHADGGCHLFEGERRDVSGGRGQGEEAHGGEGVVGGDAGRGEGVGALGLEGGEVCHGARGEDGE